MQSPSHYKDTRLMDVLIDRQVPFAEGNIMLHEVNEGSFDEMFVSLKYLKEKYE